MGDPAAMIDPANKRTLKTVLTRLARYLDSGAEGDSKDRPRSKMEARLCGGVLRQLTSGDAVKIAQSIATINRENEGASLRLFYLPDIRITSMPPFFDFRTEFFYTLAQFLVHHDLALLKPCERCAAFFIVERGEHRFCSEKCRTANYDKTIERRKKRAKWMVEYRKRKKEKQERALRENAKNGLEGRAREKPHE